MANLLIIGASSGIGAALASRVSGEYALWCASRRPVLLDGVSFIPWDAGQGSFPVDALPETLDGLVYCPGTIRLAPFARLTDAAFREDFELNLLGAVRAIRAALPALKSSERAGIVLFSTVAVTTGMPMHASVAAAKGAVEGLVRSLAAELAPRIRVNAIAPSLTDTPMAGGLLKTDAQREAAVGRHPLGRLGKPEDIAAAAAFLLSEDASWITGEVLHVDGGMGGLRRFS